MVFSTVAIPHTSPTPGYHICGLSSMFTALMHTTYTHKHTHLWVVGQDQHPDAPAFCLHKLLCIVTVCLVQLVGKPWVQAIIKVEPQGR